MSCLYAFVKRNSDRRSTSGLTTDPQKIQRYGVPFKVLLYYFIYKKICAWLLYTRCVFDRQIERFFLLDICMIYLNRTNDKVLINCLLLCVLAFCASARAPY